VLKNDIIEPSSSPWRAQVLTVNDGRHKKRLVIDYSRTVNRFTLLDAYPLPCIDDLNNTIAKGRIFSALDLKSAYHQIHLHEKDREFTAFEACGKLFQYRRLPFGVTNGVSVFQRMIDSIIEKYELSGTYAYLDNVTVVGIDQADHDRRLEAFLRAAQAENLTLHDAKCETNETEIDFLGYRVSHNFIRPDPKRLEPLMNLPVPRSKGELQRAAGLFAYYAKWIANVSSKARPLHQALKYNLLPLSAGAIKLSTNCVPALLPPVLLVFEMMCPFVFIATPLSTPLQPLSAKAKLTVLSHFFLELYRNPKFPTQLSKRKH